MEPLTCSVEGCDRVATRRGWCSRHYQNWWKREGSLRPLKSRTIEERFWAKVDKMGPVPSHRPELGNCWVWTKGCNGSGYGTFCVNNRELTAHRVSWEFINGPISEGLFACHHCDNRKCVNPAHLFLGTNQDNIDDMWSKGRAARLRGEAHPRAKLTEQDVMAIRERYAQGGISYERLGAEFHVTGGAIGGIINRRNWTWVTPDQSGG